MVITVRPAAEDDLRALLGLYRELHPSDSELPIEEGRRIWRDVVTTPGRVVLVAEVDTEVIGTADCTVLANLTRGGRAFMLVENVVVTARRRRLGAGRMLFQYLLELARGAGCYKVQLLSRADRHDAHAFYRSVGLRPAAVGYRTYLKPD